MRQIFTCFLLTLFSFSLQAQDARFSQFFAAPLHLNPAMIGVFDGNLRVTANYRELYSSILADTPFRTFASSVDLRYRVSRNDFGGFGLSVMRDEVGISQFNRFRANLGFSYLKQLGGGSRYASTDQFLIAGVQAGVGQRGFDWGKLWFSHQFDQEGASIQYDSPSGENFDQQNTGIYLDMNAGLLWYALFDDNMSIYFGGSIHHINTPNISFLDDSQEILYRKWVGHAGGELPFTDHFSILPGIAVMGQSKSFSTTVGANFRYAHNEWRELALRAGLWAHVANQLQSSMGLESLIFTAVLEMERWNLGLSYDITSSQLATANNARGAFEISLIYVHPSKSRFRVDCPNF